MLFRSQDDYKAWKTAGANAGALIGDKRVEQVGVQLFERALLPELKKRPPGLSDQ